MSLSNIKIHQQNIKGNIWLTWWSVCGSHTTRSRGSLKAAWIWLVKVPGVKRPALAVAPVWLANFRIARYEKQITFIILIVARQSKIRSGEKSFYFLRICIAIQHVQNKIELTFWGQNEKKSPEAMHLSISSIAIKRTVFHTMFVQDINPLTPGIYQKKCVLV